MAGVLESLSVRGPRAVLRNGSTPMAAMAPASSSQARIGAKFLPDFRGLRVATRPSRIASTTAFRDGRAARRGMVVCETQKTAVNVPDVTTKTWQSLVLESDAPVLVEFWASWCGPCRMIHPVIDKLSKDYEGKLKCFRLNTDENPDIATQYGIRSIPTMIIFKNGEKKESVIGAVPESTLISCVERFL